MQQCLHIGAVFVSARDFAASLPAIASITLNLHRDFCQSIHSSGPLVPSSCLLHLHRAPLAEKPYPSRVSGLLRADAASHSLPCRAALRNIHSAPMERVIQDPIAQPKPFSFETTLRQVTFDQSRQSQRRPCAKCTNGNFASRLWKRRKPPVRQHLPSLTQRRGPCLPAALCRRTCSAKNRRLPPPNSNAASVVARCDGWAKTPARCSTWFRVTSR